MSKKSFFKALEPAFVTRDDSNLADFMHLCVELDCGHATQTQKKRIFAVEVSREGIVLGVTLAGIKHEPAGFHPVHVIGSFAPNTGKLGHTFIVYPFSPVLEKALEKAWFETLGLAARSVFSLNPRPDRLQVNHSEMSIEDQQMFFLGCALAGLLPIQKEVYDQNVFIDEQSDAKEVTHG